MYNVVHKKADMLHAKIGEATKEVDYDKEVDAKAVHSRLLVTRIRLLQKEPFYGTIAINLFLQGVEQDHKVIRTAAVDGKNFYYNPAFIDALDDEELVFLVAHEVMHCVLRHLTRRGKRDPKIWNHAGDYIINYILVRDNVGTFPSVGGLYEESYGNRTTEDLYEELYEKAQNSGGGSGDSSDGSGAGGPGSGGNFDDHIEVTVGNDGNGGDDDADGTTGSVNISEDEASEIENEITSTIMQAADVGRKAGKVPAEIERLIENLLEPKMNWRDIVRETAKSQVTSDYTWKRLNRRYMSQRIMLPSLTVDDHFDFVIGIDASGSMSNDQLRDFLSEIYAIADSFMSFKVGIFTFDTKVYNYQEFTQDTIDDLLYYNPKGGGGTDFMCCWEFFKEEDIVPETFIMLTDGMPFDSWGDPEYCETVFLIHDKYAINNKVRAPFGTTLYYDDYVNE